MVVRAGVYARISSDRDGDNLAISRQLVDCEALAERKDWAIVERYVDADISAYKGKVRPAYRRMLEDIEAGAIDAVVVYHHDRLHRHPRELEDFIDLCARTQTRMATVSGDLDLSTHEGQLMARITGAVARKESDDKSRRIQRKHEELAEAGKVSGGGSRPYGYEADKRTVRPAEAEIIRELARRTLAGDSLKALCRDLSERGVLTATGKQWSPQTLRRMLLSARISGQREHHGQVVAKAEWPAIITPAETDKLRAKLQDPERRTNRAARRSLLPRVLRCGHCRTQLVSRPRADRVRRYVCPTANGGCGRMTVLAEPVELVVSEAVLHRLESPLLPEAIKRPADDAKGAEWQQEAELAQAKLDELAEMWAAGEITRGEWQKARPPIERRLTTARKKLAQLNRQAALVPFIGDAKRVREEWPTMTLTRQAEIVRALVEYVEVLPARRGYNRFDPSRLRPVWRA
ncbi:MAG TPA: recombinase family protein [Solirubrobacteraceae bacterium]|nr:recombinase family protein [Solirubrobacteraceae bacterium]